jgi:hypothetical protein
VTIDITDEFDEDSTEKFAIGNPTLIGVSSVNGNGTLQAKSSGSAEWLLIPRREAAPERDTIYKVKNNNNKSIQVLR